MEYKEFLKLLRRAIGGTSGGLRFMVNGMLLSVDCIAADATGVVVEFKPELPEPHGIEPEWARGRPKPRTSQTDAIRAYLMTGKTLTPLESLEMFGCLRLGARIADLRKLGYGIDSTLETDPRTGKRFARYRMVDDRLYL